jgi:hypothetical protein
MSAALNKLPVSASGKRDGCTTDSNEQHSNRPWCDAGYAAVAGVTADDPRAAVTAARQALATSCAARTRLEDDASGISALSSSVGGVPGPRGVYDCRGTEVTVMLARSDDPRLGTQFANYPYAMSTVTDQRLDIGYAAELSRKTGHQYVLVAQDKMDYYVAPATNSG